MNNDIWMITGGCGFIGRRLIQSLINRGQNRIRVVDNLSVGTLAELRAVAPVEEYSSTMTPLPAPTSGTVQFVNADIMEADSMLHACAQVGVVVHLAANTGVGPSVEDPRKDCMTNVIGTFNVLEASRQARVRRFIFASSGAPIGEVTPPIHEELAPHPVSPYGASKLAGEGYCSAYWRSYGLETVALRFGNVYGPGSNKKSSVVAKFIRDAFSTGQLRINGNGSQTRDFIYVDDLVEAIWLSSCVADIGGETFQIATQRETTVSEIADMLMELFKQQRISLPALVYDSPRTGDVQRNFSDTAKAQRRLGWSATTSVPDGLNRTLHWFLEMGFKHEDKLTPVED